MRLRLLLLLAALPGCLGSTGGGGSGASVPSSTGDAIPWSMTDCAFVVAFVPVPAERLQPLVPEGFTVSAGGGPLATVQGGAYLGVEAFQCASGAGLDGAEVAPLEYGSFFTGIEPPADLVVADADVHFLKWDVLVPDAPRREALVAEGLPARTGSARIERTLAAAPQLVASLTLDEVGAFRIEGAIQGAATPDAGTFVEFMPRDDGGVGLWRADWDTQALEQGRAILTFEPGSWAAGVAGERATGAFITGTWSFANGSIRPSVGGGASSGSGG